MPRKEEIGATRDSYVYRLRVPNELKVQWDDYCAKNNKKIPSSTIRAIMRYIIQDEMPPEIRNWIAEQIEGQVDNNKKRIEIRLTESEYEAVKLRAKNEICSTQRWIINCVRASLTNEPQFTLDIAKALWESSYQLRAIGNNLNQIAKKLNEGGYVDVTVKKIEEIRNQITQHTGIALALLDASLGRWKIKNS